MRAIARKLDLNFKTVRRYVHVASVDVLLAGGVQLGAALPDRVQPHGSIRVEVAG